MLLRYGGSDIAYRMYVCRNGHCSRMELVFEKPACDTKVVRERLALEVPAPAQLSNIVACNSISVLQQGFARTPNLHAAPSILIIPAQHEQSNKPSPGRQEAR